MQRDRRALVGALLVALAGLQYGVAVVLGKWAVSEDLPAQASLAIRFAIAALILAAIHIVTRRSMRPAVGERRALLLLGGVGYAVETSFFFAALGHGTVAGVTLLFYTYPVLAALAHAALGMGRLRAPLLVALGLSLSGAAIVIVAQGGVAIDGPGIMLAFGAAISFTVYMVGSERLLRRTDPMTSAMWLCAAAAVGLTVMAVATGQLRLTLSASAMLVIAGMGVATAGAFTCFLGGLRLVGSVRTGIISTFEPLSASLLAALFLSEPLGAAIVVGGALIIAAAVVAVRSSAAPAEPPIEPLP